MNVERMLIYLPMSPMSRRYSVRSLQKSNARSVLRIMDSYYIFSNLTPKPRATRRALLCLCSSDSNTKSSMCICTISSRSPCSLITQSLRWMKTQTKLNSRHVRTFCLYTVSHFSYAPLIKCKIIRKINVIYLF